MIVDEEESRADDGEEAECPRAPEAIERCARAKILDDGYGNEEQGVNLVLPSFLVVVQKPSPVQVAARPDFSVAPKSQEHPRKQK